MTQSHAYLVTDGVTQIIDPPGSISAGAWDINPSGEIVGFFTDQANRTHGFLLHKGAYTVIDFPGNDVVATKARGINPQGDVVGQYVDSRGLHGFVAIRSQGQGHSPVNP
jgi:probable HAF family extracellular repeat protein